jgi:hypothetical protein
VARGLAVFLDETPAHGTVFKMCFKRRALVAREQVKSVERG